MFDSAASEADVIITLWWVLFGVGLLVFLAVAVLLLAGWRRSRRADEQPASDRNLHRGLVVGVAAAVVLLFTIQVATLRSAQPFADEREGGAINIDVVGKRWWWAVTYVGDDGEPLFHGANEIQVPVGVPVRLRLLSDNVIHSWWVPKLGGKVDLIPGRVNELWFKADRPGVYRGQCAEFCGIQHAKMGFLVIAVPPEEFAEWTRAQQRPAVEPMTPLARRGREVFANSLCITCHTVRGVAAAPAMAAVPLDLPKIGPDLTHLASRRSLAAGTLPNRKGHLAGWIADPQNVKPGSLMPSVPLLAEDFHALLHYLTTLE